MSKLFYLLYSLFVTLFDCARFCFLFIFYFAPYWGIYFFFKIISSNQLDQWVLSHLVVCIGDHLGLVVVQPGHLDQRHASAELVLGNRNKTPVFPCHIALQGTLQLHKCIHHLGGTRGYCSGLVRIWIGSEWAVI